MAYCIYVHVLRTVVLLGVLALGLFSVNLTYTVHENLAAQKRKERRIKKYPKLSKALLDPDKSTNFASTTTSKASKQKQPPVAQNELQPKPKNSRTPLSSNTDV